MENLGQRSRDQPHFVMDLQRRLRSWPVDNDDDRGSDCWSTTPRSGDRRDLSTTTSSAGAVQTYLLTERPQTTHVLLRRADLPADVDAAAIGQPGIKQGNIGRGGRDTTQSLAGSRRLPHDEIVGPSEQVDQSPPNQLLIIKDEDSDGLDAHHE